MMTDRISTEKIEESNELPFPDDDPLSAPEKMAAQLGSIKRSLDEHGKDLKAYVTIVNPIRMTRMVGWGLIVLAVIDLFALLYPIKLMDPEWELQTLGTLVDGVYLPLIGVVAVFWGGLSRRGKWEVRFLHVLSRMMLVVAIFFFLSVPLGIFDTIRLYELRHARVAESHASLQSLKEAHSTVQGGADREVLNASIKRLMPRIAAPETLTAAQIEKVTPILSRRLEGQIQQLTKRINMQAAASTIATRETIKWNLKAFVCGLIFLGAWFTTGWLRKRD